MRGWRPKQNPGLLQRFSDEGGLEFRVEALGSGSAQGCGQGLRFGVADEGNGQGSGMNASCFRGH